MSWLILVTVITTAATISAQLLPSFTVVGHVICDRCSAKPGLLPDVSVVVECIDKNEDLHHSALRTTDINGAFSASIPIGDTRDIKFAAAIAARNCYGRVIGGPNEHASSGNKQWPLRLRSKTNQQYLFTVCPYSIQIAMHHSKSAVDTREGSAQLKVRHVNYGLQSEGAACRKLQWSHCKLESIIPCISWMKTYKAEYLKADVVAGVTVGTMLVPQALSYAKLAGLAPVYGLYAGFVPAFAYAIFGSSRQLACGPVAIVSLLVFTVLSNIIPPDEEHALKNYTELAVLLALIVGILECLMGLLRLGWLIRFISHSVTSGFTSASAIIIGLSQAKYFLGYSLARSGNIVPVVQSIIKNYKKFQLRSFLMGSVLLTILLVMKHVGKTSKRFRFVRAVGPLTAIFFGTVFIKLFHPSSITLVGPIPQGLPTFSIHYNFTNAKHLFPTALMITGVAILESVAIAKALAAKNGYELDSNQELFGLGMANVLGSLFHAYPTTGSFSRSAVNHDAGAKTGLAGVITGITIGCALVFLTPLFEDIPQCSLAAIVISAVIGLIDYEEAIFLWRVEKKDFSLWMAAFLFTLFFGVEFGVLIAVGLSLVFVIYESANPHIAVLGRLPGTTVYRNIKQYTDAYTYHGIAIIRIDAPIYFANVSFIQDRLRRYELCSKVSASRGIESEDIRFVIIEMSPVTYVDSTAIHAIKEIYNEYKSRHIQMALSNLNANVMRSLARAGIPELIGTEWYFIRVHDAVQVCQSRMQRHHHAHPFSDDGEDDVPDDDDDQQSMRDERIPLMR